MLACQKLMTPLLALILLGGCIRENTAPTQTHEDLVKEAIASMRNVTAALKSVTDKDTAEQAVNTVKKEVQNLQSNLKILLLLGKASPTQKVLANQHTLEVTAASQEMQPAIEEAYAKIESGQIPPEIGQKLRAAVTDFGQAFIDFGNQLGSQLKIKQ